MAPRSRSRILYTNKGTSDRFTWVDDTSGGPQVERLSETCTDSTNNPNGGASFAVYRDYYDGGRINKPLTNYFGAYFHDYTCDMLTSPGMKQWHDGVDSPSNTDIANQVQAGSNPSRPWVDVVASIAQLPQGVETIRESFRQFYGLGKVAQTYLKYKFDVAPNVSDLLKILLFQGKVDDRIKELTRLKQKGLHRTITVGEYTSDRTYGEVLQSANSFIYHTIQRVTSERCWGYIVWTPNADFPDTATDMRRLAVQSVYGLTIDSATLWELIPWSWLMDWCTNIGDYVSACRNLVPATPSAVQVMRETRTRTSFGPYEDTNLGLTMSGGYFVSERKLRSTVSPSIEAHMPLLTAEHASILGSIAVLRR